MTSPSGFLTEEHQLRWAAVTYQVRMCELALVGAADPKPGSLLAAADAAYTWEKASGWARTYLTSGIEHMLMWCDQVAPYDFDGERVNHVRFMTYLLIGRAGLESTAHALWLLEVDGDPMECTRRLIRLMLKDFGYHKKAQEVRGGSVEKIEQRIADTNQRAADLGLVEPKVTLPGYEGLVKAAAEASGEDASEWSYLWNAASGAAHGQNWFSMVGYDIELGEEYEPGHFRSTRIPDAVYITELMEAAGHAVQWATFRWLDLAGYDAPTRLQESMVAVHERMPKKA
ncbi:hypothetical protein [Gordonia sp. 852002-50395_SCH5434458]|uniref:hypothetical protein n=1 Tax=Gordonia sp. 852002-50395_SCH5434458 TaxID=1834090 RepID=UPI0012E70E0F|nr:hypothetical protein [Gordonia sp. 852002-50395_SCH5434458]